MSASSPLVSVVIPTHNRCELLFRHALPAALCQEDVELEVVVVDDGSSDETAARLAGVLDQRLRVVRHDEARRLPAARNSGVSAARGEWLAFLDDDDLWAPTKLREQLDAATAAGASWAYAATVAVDERLDVIEADDFPEPGALPELLLTGNHVPGGGSAVIARKELVQRVGGFDERLRFFEDWDLWLRLTASGLPAASPSVLAARLVHSSNMVLTDRAAALSSFELMLSKHREVTRRDRLAIAEWIAQRQVSSGYGLVAARLYFETAVRYRSAGNLAAALGALFGRRGIIAVSKLLLRLHGASHLEEAFGAPVARPTWLDRYVPIP
jgi:glycosyltransferase involved in cell wall biosynthesis